jgi:hypothetical protein
MSEEQSTDWARIARELAAPFRPAEVEFKPGKGNSKPIIFIDARAVQDRLDAVVGAGGWTFAWDPLVMDTAVRVVRGTLTVRGVSKSDIGDGDTIEPNKAAVSDALKRCGVQWGIGRYLYGLDVHTAPDYTRWYAAQTEQPAAQATASTRSNGHAAAASDQQFGALGRAGAAPVGDFVDHAGRLKRIRAAISACGQDADTILAKIAAKNNAAVWDRLPLARQDEYLAHYEAEAARVQGAAT